MGPHVVLELLGLDEGESTDGAGVRTSAVDLLVPPQRSGSWEALVAHVAAERFESSVAPHVCLHVLKRLPADVTGSASGFSVRSQVVRQTA